MLNPSANNTSISWAKLAADSPSSATADRQQSVASSTVTSSNYESDEKRSKAWANEKTKPIIKYTRDQLLSLFKPSPPPPGLDESLSIFSENSLDPIGNSEMGEDEKTIWDSDVIHSEMITKRQAHSGRTRGSEYRGRGRGRGGAHHGHPQHHHLQQQQQDNINNSGGWQIAGGKRTAQNSSNNRSSYENRFNFNSKNNGSGDLNDSSEPLPDDIWDLPPKTGPSQGTFANGAFLSSSGGPTSDIMAVSPSEWKNKGETSIGLDALSNSFAILGHDSLNSSASWDPIDHSSVSAARKPFIPLHKQLQQQHQQSLIQPAIPKMTVPSRRSEGPIWFYNDPQGKVQGPFTGHEMQQWFEAGYFPDQLLVRLSTDERFTELVTYVQTRMNGQVNFLEFPHIEIPISTQSSANSYLSTLRGGSSAAVEPVIVTGKHVVSPTSNFIKSGVTKTLPSELDWGSSSLVEPVASSHSRPSPWTTPILDPIIPPVIEESISSLVENDSRDDENEPKSPVDQRYSRKEVIKNTVALTGIPKVETVKKNVQPAKKPETKTRLSDSGSVWGNTSNPKHDRKSIAEIQKEEEKARAIDAPSAKVTNVPRRYADTASQNVIGSATWANRSTASAVVSTGPVLGKSPKSLTLKDSHNHKSMVSSTESLYTAPSTPAGNRSEHDLPQLNSVASRETTISKWFKEQMKPLDGKVDSSSLNEILQTLEDPYTITEIIHDAVGINFRIVDPQKLSSEFIKLLHKHGKLTGQMVIPAAPPHSAMVVAGFGSSDSSVGKQTSRSSNEELGFVQVVSKKKKKKASSEDSRITGAPVGVGGKTVVGATSK